MNDEDSPFQQRIFFVFLTGRSAFGAAHVTWPIACLQLMTGNKKQVSNQFLRYSCLLLVDWIAIIFETQSRNLQTKYPIRVVLYNTIIGDPIR